MNISSAVVKVKPGNHEFVITELNKTIGCEVHIHEGEKIIITIEAKDVNAEIGIVRSIEQINHVLTVEMVYAYSEDELEKERDKVEFASETPEWLNNDNIDANQIKYGGDLRKKI